MKKHNEKHSNFFWQYGSGFHHHFLGTCWGWGQSSKKRLMPASSTCTVILFFSFFFLFLFALLFPGWIDASIFSGGDSTQNSILSSKKVPKKPKFPLNCTQGNMTNTCPNNYRTSHNPTNNDHSSSNNTCPDYFRWIHEDLQPWKETGITPGMIKKARRTAHFRLVIVNGKAYMEKYRKSFQTRDMFTLWGILQLLRWYPGRLPDLDLMFNCGDRPVIPKKNFRAPDSAPPPLFRYCSDDYGLDIVFPDWSFWGWAETNIKPWGNMLKDIKEGNKRTKWKDRVPYAYWRGNPNVAPTRGDLMRCNVSDKDDWNTRLYVQDWNKESQVGYKQSNLEDQCTHRYKIFIEGWAWSVSEKYILACDSMTLYVRPSYFTFFNRGMVPLQHYWPIRDNNKCPSLKFAVAWGNNHTDKARGIGEAAGNFIQEDLKMDHVYDYMLNLLTEYAKLLKFKPTVPPGAVEVCSKMMVCLADGIWKKFMVESMVKSPSDTSPCTMPPPYDPLGLKDYFDRKWNATRQVEIWENEYFEGLKNNHSI